MAKIIKLTPEILDEVKRTFEQELSNAKLSDGKFSFTKSFGSTSRKASVNYTEKAWQKMQMLIREFDKEVAWHGIAYRGDDPEKDEYYITDILVYPQEVTGATVTSDQEKYQTWLMGHDDDVFNNIRMQGHSHVNMSTTPSSVDTELYRKILEQLDDTMFYIFLIYNKRGDKTYMIYDMAKNVMFETADVTVNILDDGTGLNDFLADAKKKVQDHTVKTYGGSSYQGYGSGYGSGYSGCGNYAGGYSSHSSPSYNYGSKELPKPASTYAAQATTEKKPSTVPADKKEDTKKNGSTSASSKSNRKSFGRKKGRRRDNKIKSFPTKIGKGSSYAYGFEDDDDDPYVRDEMFFD